MATEVQAAILGTGSRGTAFGRHLCHKWDRVVLWGIEKSQVDSINQKFGERKLTHAQTLRRKKP